MTSCRAPGADFYSHQNRTANEEIGLASGLLRGRRMAAFHLDDNLRNLLQCEER
jgi:hypothetical protein